MATSLAFEELEKENEYDVLVEEWYQALQDEDCLRTMKLLKKDPGLIWIASTPGEESGSTWKGRSVFHVAARRGCVELIVRALKVCRFEDMVDEKERPKCKELFERVLTCYNFEEMLLSFPMMDNEGWSLSPADGEVQGARTSSLPTDGQSDQGAVSSSSSPSDLSKKLEYKDGWYKMDALAMGTICGNKNLVNLLSYARKICNDKLGWIEHEGLLDKIQCNNEDEKMKSLRDKTKQILSKLVDNDLNDLLKWYSKHPDFNFLHPYEYLFHFSCTSIAVSDARSDVVRSLRKIVWEDYRSRPLESDFRFLMKLQDGQGRPPAHVAADEQMFQEFLQRAVLCRSESTKFALMAQDARSRIAYTRLSGQTHAIRSFRQVSKDMEWAVDTALRCDKWPFDERVLSKLNGFRSGRYESDMLCAAIIRKDNDIFRTLLELSKTSVPPLGNPYAWLPSDPEAGQEDSSSYEFVPVRGDEFPVMKLSYLHLACLANNEEFLECYLLSMCQSKHVQKLKDGLNYDHKHNHILHHFAAYGNYEMLKAVMDISKCDPLIDDAGGNTALHYALAEPIHLKWHLCDYTSCQEVLEKGKNNIVKKNNILDKIAKRKRCVKLLLQVGCDVFKFNKDDESPYPRGCLADDKEFLEWWHTEQTKEFGVVQQSLTSAANAIAVTGTLIATASYVGPLTPPTGYDDIDDIRYGNVWVATFVFCDTLSFYLAIAAIALSLIPALPTPQQAMLHEFQRTRRLVTIAIGVLFPSIICVLLAFTSSALAVVNTKIITSIGGILTITTMCIVALFIIVVFCVLFVRILGVLFPRVASIISLYKLSFFIL